MGLFETKEERMARYQALVAEYLANPTKRARGAKLAKLQEAARAVGYSGGILPTREAANALLQKLGCPCTPDSRIKAHRVSALCSVHGHIMQQKCHNGQCKDLTNKDKRVVDPNCRTHRGLA